MTMKALTSGALLALVLVGSAGCGDAGLETSPTRQEESAGASAMAMTLLARVERSSTNVVSFYDSEIGIVISETGLAEESGQHASLDELRAQGMTAAYRTLAKDESAEVPAELLAAESLWRERAVALLQNPTPAAEAPPRADKAIRENVVDELGGSFGVPDQVSNSAAPPSMGEALGSVKSALGGLSTDAAWWKSLPICKYKTYATDGQFSPAPAVAWFDSVWCVTDVTWATTSWRDTMYYEVTAFGQGNDATVTINKWISGAWQVVTNATVAYRYFRTFSFPPENGAYYYANVSGNGGQVIGISERYRLAMPQPAFVNNKPSDVEYDFSNDLQGITHNADNWYLTRTKYKVSGAAYGLIAKAPLTQSLNDDPNGQGMPRAWNRMTNGAEGSRYNHFGDLVHRSGRVYVSMDGPAGAAIGIYDTNLVPIAFATLDHNTKANLVAYNSKDGFFYVPSSDTTFQKYRISISDNTATAVWKGQFVMAQRIPGAFQGAKFSAKGNLWLLTGIDSKEREFWGIDTASGVRMVKGNLSPGDADESEGLDIFDLDVETRPGMAGQLHLQMLNNQVDDDNWWLMHFRAPMDRL